MQQEGKNITARIFKLESLNTHNGPGYRTVIYFKGCPLSCKWCHNPEGIALQKEIWVNHKKCIECLSCIQVCSHKALSFKSNKIEIDRHNCEGCYTCVDACPSKAIEKIGEDYTVSEVFARVRQDKPFLEASGGGITVTGGEPGTAPEFVSQLFQQCQAQGIHTAFDTSGLVSEKALEMIIPYTDLVFFDLKVMDETQAIELTGHNNSKIMKSLSWLKTYIEKNEKPGLQFRTPIIPGETDQIENLNAIAKLICDEFSDGYRDWELNLFNDICEDKYNRFGKKWMYKNCRLDKTDHQRLEEFQRNNRELNITISGFLSK